MHIAYLILPGTSLSLSRDGGPFRIHTTRKPLQFIEPEEETEEMLTFSRGEWRFIVKRAKVVVSRWGGGQGENQFGA